MIVRYVPASDDCNILSANIGKTDFIGMIKIVLNIHDFLQGSTSTSIMVYFAIKIIQIPFHLYFFIFLNASILIFINFFLQGSTSTSTTGSFAIKITQIPCDSPVLPPRGCLQYFYG